MLVTVEDGRGVKLRGDPAHPVTRGFLCGKVAQYLEREYSPGRLLYPQRRVGAKGEGRFERISWDEALDAIAGGLFIPRRSERDDAWTLEGLRRESREREVWGKLKADATPHLKQKLERKRHQARGQRNWVNVHTAVGIPLGQVGCSSLCPSPPSTSVKSAVWA